MFFISLEGKRKGCFWAGSIQRSFVLSSPALPCRPAVPDPTGPWCVRFFDSIGSCNACWGIGFFRITGESIYSLRPNAIRCFFQVHLGLIFELLSGPRFNYSRMGVDFEAPFESPVCSLRKGKFDSGALFGSPM